MGKWWLISWTTYGTWLPGDNRGFCTLRGEQYVPPPRRYAKPGEPTYQASDYGELHEFAKSLCDKLVHLSLDEMEVALHAMVKKIAMLPIVPGIMSLGDWHVHWLCYFDKLKIRPTVSRIKAFATSELNTFGFQGKKPWTKGCNMKSKTDHRACRSAYKYVRDHREQGCLIYEWPIPPQYLVFE